MTDKTTEALDGIGKRSDIGLPRLSGRPWPCLISTPRLRRGETGEKLGRKPGLRSHCDMIMEGLRATAPVILLFARSVECERSNSGEQK